MPVKPLIYVKRVFIPLEEQFKYLSDESSDDSDEEWTEGPSKKKGKIDSTANQGINFSSVTFETQYDTRYCQFPEKGGMFEHCYKSDYPT